MKKIFKICNKKELEDIKKNHFFKGSENDKLDGFIHFSTAAQVRGTIEKYFKGNNSLFLLEVHTKNLNVIWERSRDNSYFPHLYGPLPIVEISHIYELSIGENGKHIIPQDIFTGED